MDFNTYNYIQYAWWNYFQHQAYAAWLKQMESLPKYQPLYSDDVWKFSVQDSWNTFIAQQAPKKTEPVEQVKEEIDWGEEAIKQIAYEKKARAEESLRKKIEKKRERNQIRNQRKKELRRAAKAEAATIKAAAKKQFEELTKFSKHYNGRVFGSGWAQEKNAKNIY